jgi:hypothetical protein
VALTAARRDRSSRRWPGASARRRDAERVAFGDAVDFWRVTDVEHGRRLRLRAEMRLPGAAVLELPIEPCAESMDRCRLVQTARFVPRGLVGLAYLVHGPADAHARVRMPAPLDSSRRGDAGGGPRVDSVPDVLLGVAVSRFHMLSTGSRWC